MGRRTMTRACSCLTVWLLASDPSSRGATAEGAHADANPTPTTFRTWDAAKPPLQLLWFDLAGYPELTKGAAQQAQATLAAIGVESRFRIAQPETDLVHPNEIGVVLLPRHPQGQTVMGATARGKVSVSVWVYLSSVFAALGLLRDDGSWPGNLADQRIALAVGRVATHEVVHALAPGLSHSRAGLMAPALGRARLLSRRVEVSAETRNALRAGLVRWSAAGGP